MICSIVSITVSAFHSSFISAAILAPPVLNSSDSIDGDIFFSNFKCRVLWKELNPKANFLCSSTIPQLHLGLTISNRTLPGSHTTPLTGANRSCCIARLHIELESSMAILRFMQSFMPNYGATTSIAVPQAQVVTRPAASAGPARRGSAAHRLGPVRVTGSAVSVPTI
jgi:hypothetical protein